MDNVKLAYTYTVHPPQDEDETVWKPDELGPGIHAVIRFTESGGEQVQELQFGADYFTEETAIQWLQLRGIKAK